MTTLYRADGLLDLETVNKQKIVVVGLGSLGSLVMGNLIYPWREIILVDPELLEIDNVERHLLSPHYVGKPKVAGVKDVLVEWGIPAERVIAYHGGVQDILYDHGDASLVIVGVDNRKAKIFIDGWARSNNIPMLVGGVYPKGNGGHVVALPKPADICYACAAHALKEDEYAGKQNDDYGLSLEQLLDANGNMHKVPSLKAPISTIAADMANMAIRILEGGDVPAHVLYHAIGWETVLTLA
ncbi:MAG: ThiF family adenylyltransferase, partial [Patescibacteria group bacterium]